MLIESFWGQFGKKCQRALTLFTTSKLESLLLEIYTKETIGWIQKFLSVITEKLKQLKLLIADTWIVVHLYSEILWSIKNVGTSKEV